MPTPINEPLRVTVARIEEKVDTLIGQRDDLEKRTRSLESWKYGMPASIILAVAGLVTAIVKGHGA